MIGIYKLVFNNTDKVYIGQSIDIKNRYMAHIRSMRSNKCSIKLHLAYKKYGLPKLEVLEEVEDNYLALNIAENKYIELYNSVTNGFNTTSFNIGERGKSAKQQGIIYEPLISPTGEEYTVDNINDFARKFNLDSGGLSRVLNKEYLFHKGWRLKSTPDKKEYPKLLSPDNNIYTIMENEVTEFANLHGLDNSNLLKLLKGKAKTHRGWKLL